MTKLSCALRTEYDSKTLSDQQSRWNLVLGVSNLVKLQADKHNWDVVVVLADQRDKLVKEFFSEPLCTDLYDEVLSGVAEMEAQHEILIAELSAKRNNIDARERELHILREAAIEDLESFQQERQD